MSKKHVAIAIPVYCESKNLQRLYHRLELVTIQDS